MVITSVIAKLEDATIAITNGDVDDNIIIDIVNSDKESISICISKRDLNEIVKLVNKKL